MDMVKQQFPDLKEKLAELVTKIADTQGKPEQLTVINDYLTHSVAGIQAVAQQIKSTTARSGRLSGQAARATGNPEADKILKAAGYILS